jgi:hypothetical protein
VAAPSSLWRAACLSHTVRAPPQKHCPPQSVVGIIQCLLVLQNPLLPDLDNQKGCSKPVCGT